MRSKNKRFHAWVIFFSFLLSVLLYHPFPGSAEGTKGASQPPIEQSGQVETIMAGLSDEQVRQMLLSELQKDPQEEQYSKQQKMMGPADLFHRLLNKLSGEHSDNEMQFRALLAGIPNILPDLYKVFLTL